MIAEVALNVPLRRTFDYRVPPEEAERVGAGMRVIVPFGRRTLTGIVTGLKPASEIPEQRLKTLQRLPQAEVLFPPPLLAFTRWVADYYFCGWGEVLDAALPCGLAARYRIRHRLRPGAEGAESALSGLSPGLRRLIATQPAWSEAQWARAAADERERGWLAGQAGAGGGAAAPPAL